MKERWRLLLALLATLGLVLPVGYLWQHSRVPSSYSVRGMGYLDAGGGPRAAAPRSPTRSVRDLTVGTDRPADRVVDLTARRSRVRLADGQRVDGYTLNGTTPGPLLEVDQGDLVEVRLTNANVPDGVTLHWHGLDVPNAEDGVAGVTQDAVPPGGHWTYRFLASRSGSYWYHSHQVSHEQVRGGLLGALVVRPRHPDPGEQDVVALVHTYDGVATVGGRRTLRADAEPGRSVRLRVVNTDAGPVRAWLPGAFRVLAVDGRDVNRPTEVTGRAVLVTAGGRVDLGIRVPRDGSSVRVQVGGAAVVVGPGGPERAAARPPVAPTRTVDLLSYGTPAPLGFDPARADRHFRYAIGRRPGFVRGRPGLWWSVNGHLFPHLPMFVVSTGDVVRMHLSNTSGDVHPMHLHGHHAVVLARDGVRATGSPWWFDSLNLADGETYDIAFVADNPGIWMDHCHNLRHAQQGLVTHLMYTGVTEPYRVGGSLGNEPE